MEKRVETQTTTEELLQQNAKLEHENAELKAKLHWYEEQFRLAQHRRFAAQRTDASRSTQYSPERSERFLFISAPVGRKGKNRRLTQRSIEKLVEKYATAFGKPALTVHSLRHSFATRYYIENNDVPKLKNQSGHSSIQTKMIYTHLTDDQMRDAVNNMDK
ncbi:integrase [Paenibacillus brasilensis]|uniref:Integrase n=1 Tax=Paenibacillus brasilensis TaxID=128574 RepID=A0ABU0L3N3_9BACL|nr:integrase [Paenibacillus brasilensis]